MITELRSHTNATDSSTTAALDTLANNLIFERVKHPNTSIDGYDAPSLHSFSNPDQAFFGTLAA